MARGSLNPLACPTVVAWSNPFEKLEAEKRRSSALQAAYENVIFM